MLTSAWAALRTVEGQRRLAWALLGLLVLADMVLVGQHTIGRYQTYRAAAFDLGNMNQAVWNTLHGSPLRFTNRGLDYWGPPTRLGVHVEPILFLVAPLYLIHDGPETLLLAQTIGMALGAIPLFLLSLRKLPTVPLLGVAFAAAYLLSPAYLGVVLWDFHSVAFAAPLLILAIWAIETGHTRTFILACALAVLTKEDVGLAVALLGLLVATIWRRPALGIATFVLASAYVALCFGVILPRYSSSSPGGNNFWYRYSWLGGSADAAVRNILRNPLLPLSILDAARMGYLASLLRVGGGLVIFAPLLLLGALPDIAVNTLSNHVESYSGFFQYNAVPLAFLAAGAVYGVAALYHARMAREQGTVEAAPVVSGPGWPRRLANIARWIAYLWRRALAYTPVPTRWLPLLVVLWLLVTGWWNLSVTGGGRIQGFWEAGTRPNPQQAQIDALLKQVPGTASVAATDSLNPNLSSRYTIYLMPDPLSYQAEYVAADIPRAIPISRQDDQKMLDRMLASGRYTVVGRAGDVILLHRTGAPLAP